MKHLILLACVTMLLFAVPLHAIEGDWQIVGTVPGGNYTGVVFANGYIYAVAQHQAVSGVPLYKINPATMAIEETVYLNLSNYVQGIAWDGQYLWISNVGFYLYRYDLVTHELQWICTRPSNPEMIGLTWAGNDLYCTGWHGNIPPEYILRLNTADCSYEVVKELPTIANFGIAAVAGGFYVCGKYEGWPLDKKLLSKYSFDGELLYDFRPFNFQAYDIAFDAEGFLWVCDYGLTQGSDAIGHVYKMKLIENQIEPQFVSLKVIEQTGSINTYAFDPLDPKLYQEISDLGLYHSDFMTGGGERYDIFFSDKAGYCLNLLPGDPLPDPIYITVKCMDLNTNNWLPDPAPNWIGAGNNIDAVVLEMFDGSMHAVELTRIEYGLCDFPPSMNLTRVAENALGEPDAVITGMGGGLSVLTMRMGTAEPFVCAGLNSALIVQPNFVWMKDWLRIWNAPVLFPADDPFSPADDQIRVVIDGTEIVIPPAATTRLGARPIYTYFSLTGGKIVSFVLDLQRNQWMLNTYGISTRAMDNENGITVNVSIGDYFYEKTMFMDERADRFSTILTYNQNPPTQCGSDVPVVIAGSKGATINADASSGMPGVALELGAVFGNLAESERPADREKATALEEVFSRIACADGSELDEMDIEPTIIALKNIPNSAAQTKGAAIDAAGVRLHANYPNPFNPSTMISFSLPREMDVQLKIYDVSGREMATLAEGRMTQGDHSVIWNGTNHRNEQLVSGIYFYRLKAGGVVQTERMVLVR